MERKVIYANPYDSAELLATCERLRRSGDLDPEMDAKYGRLIMDTVTFAIGLFRKRNKLYNEPDELYEDCVCCAVEAIRKSDPSDPVRVVRYLIATTQNRIRGVMRDKINREQLLMPYDTAAAAQELTAEQDGSPTEDPWETLKVFALKQEVPDGTQDV